MYQTNIKVVSKTKLSDEIFIIWFKNDYIPFAAKPGQFVNIKVGEQFSPYLRRPFSICNVCEDQFGIMFNILGSGTKLLSLANEEDTFDCIGPLGKGFNVDNDIKNIIIVAGGMGVAPFPFFINSLPKDVNISTFIGARNKKGIIEYGLKNINIATDDGSYGDKMNVVDLVKNKISKIDLKIMTKIFGCGPTIMLKELGKFALEKNIDCEISTECAMACGFGLCQGCPIEAKNDDKYLLVCTDGPVFNVKDIKI